MPNFFSGKTNQTPEKYMECRNWIVAKSMENPEKRLSLTDCHVLVSGISIDDMTRIFRFLDHWGIINYCATCPHNETQNDGPYLNEDSNGELSLSVAAFKSIESLIQFDKPKCRLKPEDVHGEEVSDLDIEIRERLTENQCNYCSQPLPILYYQSQKEVNQNTILLSLFSCLSLDHYVSNIHTSCEFSLVDILVRKMNFLPVFINRIIIPSALISCTSFFFDKRHNILLIKRRLQVQGTRGL